ALTVIPALLAASGPFLDGVLVELDRRGGWRPWGTRRRIALQGRRVRARRAARREQRPAAGRGWARWAHAVQAHPWPAAGLGIALLVVLTLPALPLRLGTSDASTAPQASTPRRAYELIARGFGPGANGPFLLVAEVPRSGGRIAANRVAAAVRADHDIAFVSEPAISPDGEVATIIADPRTGPQDAATTDTL